MNVNPCVIAVVTLFLACLLVMVQPLIAGGLTEPQGDIELPATWRVFGPAKADAKALHELGIERDQLATIPETLTIDGRTFEPRQAQLDANHIIDFGALFGGFKVHDVAYAYAEINAKEDGMMTLGASADWWMQWFVNGKHVCGTLPKGNVNWPMSLSDHVFDVPLRKGRNVICIRVIGGSNSFVLKAGGPRELRQMNESLEEKRRKDFAMLDAFDIADPPRTEQGYLVSRIAGERASQGVGNKIVHAGGKTFLVWQDSLKQRYFGRVRSYDHATGKWSPTVTLAEGVDEHARPTIVIDSKGYLHVVMGAHNSPFQYRRSVRPYDVSEWTPIVSFGQLTYPLLYIGADDTLYLACRPNTHDGMVLWSKKPDGPWTEQGLIVKRQNRFVGYTGMTNAMDWGPGRKTMHLSCGFFLGGKPGPGEDPRDPQGRYQGVGYMRSRDGGKTWEKADGTPIPMPAISTNMDLLEEGESTQDPKPGIQHGGVTVDSHDRPYVGYTRNTPTPCQAFLKVADEKGVWHSLPIGDAIARHWPGWGALGVKPVMTTDDVLCVMITLVPLEHPKANWNLGIHGRPEFWLRDFPELHRVVWLESRDGGKTFQPRDILTYDPQKGHLMPSIERPYSGSPIGPDRLPSFLHTVGLNRYAKQGETIQNELYWMPMDGK